MLFQHGQLCFLLSPMHTIECQKLQMSFSIEIKHGALEAKDDLCVLELECELLAESLGDHAEFAALLDSDNNE